MKKVKLLKRTRINNILSAIYDYPLLIVEAPMGFGKTTAVRNFLELKENPYLWITFLNSNGALDFFWNEFSYQIAKFYVDEGKKLKSLGFPLDVPQTQRVISILNHIDYKEEMVLVIDDYHLLKNDDIYKFIEQVVLERIDNLHIVIITRDTTNIEFVKLLSKGMCEVVSKHQLKFTEDEIRNYCLMMNKDICEDDLLKIIKYTDGWISLTYMILLGLKRGIPVGINSRIDELVESALFNSYSLRIKNFLLKLSIMDDFTSKQALFVTEEEKTDEILKKLCRENAFVFYNDLTKKYKIHNVLLDFLRARQNFKIEELNKIYGKLGQWYLDRKEFINAFTYFNRAGDVKRILSELNNPDNVRNELTEFEGSFEMFENTDEGLLNKYPIAYLQHIFLSVLRGNDENIERYSKKLDKLKLVYENMDNIDEEYRNRIIAETLIVKKFTAFNDLDQMRINNEKIIELLKGKNSYLILRENEYTFGSPHLLYIYFRDEGTLAKIREILSNKTLVYSKISNGCGTGAQYMAKAEYALETGDMEAVENNTIKTIYKAKTKDQTSIIICAYFNLMRFYILQGKAKDALCKLEELENIILEENNSIYDTSVELCKGYIYACLNQQRKIPYWLQVGDMSKASFFYEGMGFNCIVYGKAVMLSKNYLKLEMLAESFEAYFSMFSNRLGFIHNGIFKAVAKYNLYGEKEGVEELKNTLFMAQEDNIIMPFAENAVHIIDMLRIIENNNLDNKYIKKVVLFSKKYKENLDKNKLEEVKLSFREIEVLSLIAEGLKRDEVADKLVMSSGTVKSHLQNIYKKLGTSGKVSAIKIAKMHGII